MLSIVFFFVVDALTLVMMTMLLLVVFSTLKTHVYTTRFRTTIAYSEANMSETHSPFPSPCAEKQPLAPGVTQKDVDLYREIRERAAVAVVGVAPSTTVAIGTPAQRGSNQAHSLISPTSAAMAAQERCPAAIEFGPWDIETWYSSPFPQEYAR